MPARGGRGKAWKKLQAAMGDTVGGAAGASSATQAGLPRPSRVYSKMLSSPLRRCILTNKVLPSDLLLRISLARTNPTTSTSNPRLAFTPSLLHPRFSPPLAGRSAWIACWQAALDLTALRGAYKRLAPTAVWPTSFGAQVHSQLARRVEQEAELLFERARARPGWVGEGGGRRLRRSPVRRLRGEEWGRVVEEGHLGSLRGEEGREVGAVVRFGVGAVGESEEDRLSWVLPLADPDTTTPSRLSQPSAPVYSLTHFLDRATLPPSASSDSPLSARAAHWLRATVALFTRREAKLAAGADEAGPAAPALPVESAVPESDEVYVIYASDAEGLVSPIEGEDDVVPVLQALWRCRLWIGEGWEGDGELEAGHVEAASASTP